MKKLKHFAALAMALLMMLCAMTSAYAAYSDSADSTSQTEAANKYTVAQPRANPLSGTYTTNQYVKLTCATSGARIFYTTDGSTPSIFSDEYKTPIRIKGKKGESVTTVLRAIAVKTGYETSEVSEYIYTIQIPYDPIVEYMEIKNTPTKTRYKKGEELNLTGGRILVSYADGTYATIDMTESMISGFNTNTAGEKTITVTYEGFTDTFTITVRAGGTSSDDDYYDDDYPEDDEDMRPKLSGTTKQGWEEITDALTEKATASNAVIMLNGAATVPSDVIRIAAKNKLALTFIVNDDMKWKLDTALIDTETVPSIGLGIRTSAISLPELPIKEIGGTEALRLHINSNNKLAAQLVINCGSKHFNKIASLFLYDKEKNTMKLVDTQITDITGAAQFAPAASGDYIIIIDDETKIAGDLDNNLKIDVADAIILMQMIVNGEEFTAKCDFDKSGTVNALDVSAILKHIVTQ